MSAQMTLRRVLAAIAGVLFLVVGVLILIGFGGLGQYSSGLRLVMALLVLAYGVIRIRVAFKSAQPEP